MKEYDFYIVPTPIGNLGDITLRAVDVLNSVDIIACEDMRVTQKLLNHYNIKTKCISYHKFNEKERVSKILEMIQNGKKIALVSDAGTPVFCDPGAILTEELRKHNVSITSLPGANAATVLLSQISRENDDFAFIGFMPRSRNHIENIINKYKFTDIVFYESPNRIVSTLEVIKDTCDNPKVAVGRELTKVFEETIIDSAENLIKHFSSGTVKGEIAAVIFRNNNREITDNLDEKINILKAQNFKAKEISTILTSLYGVNKNEIYKKTIGN